MTTNQFFNRDREQRIDELTEYNLDLHLAQAGINLVIHTIQVQPLLPPSDRDSINQIISTLHFLSDQLGFIQADVCLECIALRGGKENQE